ncbi:MAG: phospho-N-acetylmuramoyl-pentapeptide-transferase [Deltaproteobacteria bacterium]|nr:phospho-N-acetylmuramoyl-pentapeptide-transferase [Deltaproteobacteria bacterium]
MLYHLLYPLRDIFGALNVFRYLTFRSMLAFVIAFVLVLVFQPVFIKWFRVRYLGQPIRSDGPQTHLSKQGTPTMGGLVVVLAVVVSTMLLADLTNIYVWLTVGVTLLYGCLGLLDDFYKVKVRNSKGLSARKKFWTQVSVATVAVIMLMAFAPGFSTVVAVPLLKNLSFDLGYAFIPFAVFIIVGCSNAVNLTDGLDGLVIGPVMTAAFTYGVFAYVTGNSVISSYLQISYVPGCGDLSIFAAALVAAGLGFLWFNSFPASVFMGDVGSLALGGALGILAIITKQELLLIIVGGVFVVETLSVIIQVLSFRLTGKRVFKMAPIHHHFELKGLNEPKIIVRCWIISIVLGLIAISTLKLR